MQFSTLTLVSLVAALATAQPHGHGHKNVHEKRDTVWTTEIEYVTTTVDVTTTVWVDAYATSSLSPSSVITAAPATTLLTISTSSSAQPAEFHEETRSTVRPQSPAAPVPTPSSSSVSVPPPPPAAPAVVAPPPDTPAAVPPPPPTTTPPPPPAAPVTTSAPPAKSIVAASPPASGDGTPCPSSSPCSGDLTYYDTGMGACGEVSDGTMFNVIALPYAMMGLKSNGNPYCGKTVTIVRNGKSIIATIVDKCMGCQGNSIDLSRHAWSELGIDEGVGRTQGTWYFNS